jgi:hypothetical protein
MREDWQVPLGLFSISWEELGRTSGAVTRLRGFDTLNALFSNPVAARGLRLATGGDGGFKQSWRGSLMFPM